MGGMLCVFWYRRLKFEAHHFLCVAKKESENAIGREIRKHADLQARTFTLIAVTLSQPLRS